MSTVIVCGNKPENETGVYLRENEHYLISVSPFFQRWTDTMAPSTQLKEQADANGWSNAWINQNAPKMGVANRIPNEPSLKLCGRVGGHLFPIGISQVVKAPESGELFLFANHNSWVSVHGNMIVCINKIMREHELQNMEICNTFTQIPSFKSHNPYNAYKVNTEVCNIIGNVLKKELPPTHPTSPTPPNHHTPSTPPIQPSRASMSKYTQNEEIYTKQKRQKQSTKKRLSEKKLQDTLKNMVTEKKKKEKEAEIRKRKDIQTQKDELHKAQTKVKMDEYRVNKSKQTIYAKKKQMKQKEVELAQKEDSMKRAQEHIQLQHEEVEDEKAHLTLQIEKKTRQLEYEKNVIQKQKEDIDIEREAIRVKEQELTRATQLKMQEEENARLTHMEVEDEKQRTLAIRDALNKKMDILRSKEEEIAYKEQDISQKEIELQFAYETLKDKADFLQMENARVQNQEMYEEFEANVGEVGVSHIQ